MDVIVLLEKSACKASSIFKSLGKNILGNEMMERMTSPKADFFSELV